MLRFVAFQPVVKAEKLKSKVKNAWKAKRVDALARRMKTAVGADLTSGLKAFKKSISKKDLMEAWAAGQYAHLDKHIPWENLPKHFGRAGKQLKAAMYEASLHGQAHLPAPAKNMRWSIENPHIRSFVDTRVGKLIQDISNEGRAHVKEVIARSFQVAMTPKQVADEIVGSIGLHKRYRQALRNYARKMQEIYGRTDDYRPMMERINGYEDRLLSSRALTIARTEIRQASNHGQRTMWREAARQGYIQKEKAKRIWVVDGAPCEDCEPMDGEEAGLDEPFISETEGEVEPGEMHPNCECIEILEIE